LLRHFFGSFPSKNETDVSSLSNPSTLVSVAAPTNSNLRFTPLIDFASEAPDFSLCLFAPGVAVAEGSWLLLASMVSGSREVTAFAMFTCAFSVIVQGVIVPNMP